MKKSLLCLGLLSQMCIVTMNLHAAKSVTIPGKHGDDNDNNNLKEEVGKTHKTQLKQRFLVAVVTFDLEYVKKHIDSMDCATLKESLSSLQNTKESEVYQYIASYVLLHAMQSHNDEKNNLIIVEDLDSNHGDSNVQVFLDAIKDIDNQNNDSAQRKCVLNMYTKMDKETLNQAINVLKENKKENSAVYKAINIQINSLAKQKNIKNNKNKRKREDKQKEGVVKKSKKSITDIFLRAARAGRVHVIKRNLALAEDKVLEDAVKIVTNKKNSDKSVKIKEILDLEIKERKEKKQNVPCCPICTKKIVGQKQITSLKCNGERGINHVYHTECLLFWAKTQLKGKAFNEIDEESKFKKEITCPVCKKIHDIEGILTQEEIQKVTPNFLLKTELDVKKAYKEIKNSYEGTFSDDDINLFCMAVIQKGYLKYMAKLFDSAFFTMIRVETLGYFLSRLAAQKPVQKMGDSLMSLFALEKEVFQQIEERLFHAAAKNNYLNIIQEFFKEENREKVSLDFLCNIFMWVVQSDFPGAVQEFFKEENSKVLDQISPYTISGSFQWAAGQGCRNAIQEFFKKKNSTILEKVSSDCLDRGFRWALDNNKFAIIKMFFNEKNIKILAKIETKTLRDIFKWAVQNDWLKFVQEIFKEKNSKILDEIDKLLCCECTLWALENKKCKMSNELLKNSSKFFDV